MSVTCIQTERAMREMERSLTFALYRNLATALHEQARAIGRCPLPALHANGEKR